MIEFWLLIGLVICADIRWKQQNEFYQNLGLDVGAYTESGFVNLQSPDKKNEGEFFYHLFLRDGLQSLTDVKEDDLFTIWLEGGPGSPSQQSNFIQVGPIQILQNEGVFTLKKRAQSWNKLTNIIFIDNPFNVGLSYAKEKDLIKDAATSALYLSQFLTKFLFERPQFRKCQLYLMGTSYAGHYIPKFGQRIIEYKVHDNLKGIAIGDGWIAPFDQMQYNPSFLFNIGVVDQFRKAKVEEYSIAFQKAYLNSDWLAADQQFYNSEGEELFTVLGDMNAYNFKSYHKRDSSAYINFFNKNLKQYEAPPQVTEFIPVNYEVYELFQQDFPQSTRPSIEFLLNNEIDVLIFNGHLDYIVNTPGSMQWINDLNWKYIYEWKKSQKQFLKIQGQDETQGSYKKFRNLVVATVYHAGHSTPYDNPDACFTMLKQFLNK